MSNARNVIATVLTLGGLAFPQIGQAETPSTEWCRLDAPGLWRALREEARAAGTRTVGPCPSGGDPENVPKQLVVPLPCGRALHLVRIDMPTSDIMDHLPTVIGGAPDQSDTLTRYIQGSRESAVAGAYTMSRGGPATAYDGLSARAYWIGSHEWTALQHAMYTSGALAAAAVGDDTADACAQVAAVAAGFDRGRVPPAAGLSWYDTQDALADLNAYVIAEGQRRIAANYTPLIPWEQGSTGFFRLPSETEWEFAARGGVAGLSVSGPLYQVTQTAGDTPREAAVREIAQIGISRAGGSVAGVGGLMPNAEGLFDTVGNVSEMVHDLFSLVRPDRAHGASGGAVLRGGNALTPEVVIGIPHRQEVPYFDVQGAGRSPMGGMRILLTAPVIARGYDDTGARAPDLPNPDLEERIAKSNSLRVAVRETAGATFRSEARALLVQLQTDLQSGDQATSSEQIGRVTLALEQSEAAINEARIAEVNARVRSAVDSILLIRNMSAIALVWLADLDEARQRVALITDDRRPALDQRIDNAFANVDRRIAVIGVQIAELQSTLRVLGRADPQVVDAARRTIADALRGVGIELYDEWAWPLFDDALALVQDAPGVDHTAALRTRLDIFAAERAEKYGR